MSTLAAPASAAPVAATPPTRHAVGPVVDFCCVGGLSIIACAFIHFIWPRYGYGGGLAMAEHYLTWTFFYLAFLVNWPHFLISYQILYWNYRKELLKRPRFIWAGIVAPGILIGLLTAVAVADSGWLGGWLVRTMFLLVGWHYVKQAYGLFVVLSARNKFFLTTGERRVLRSAMYALWLMYFFATNISVNVATWGNGGVKYSLLWWWPTWLTPVGYAAVGVTAVAAVAVLWRKARREGVTPPTNAIVALLSIYVWFFPALNHNLFNAHLVPFFHSAQYLLIAVLLTKNRAVAMAAEANERLDQVPEDGGGRSPWPFFWTYIGCTVVFGAFFSTILPETLDKNLGLGLTDSAPAFWLFAFVWFINVHHYFIDNKIWLRDNSEMQYLR